LCGDGLLYDFLLDRSSGLTLWDYIPIDKRHRFAKDRPLNRSDIKTQFIILLFAKTEFTKQMPLFRIVASEFPTIAAFILHAKRDTYQTLARDCQRFESAIVIGKVAAALVDRFPLVSVHDSIIADAEHADQVEAAISASFQQFGTSVSVSRTKNLGQTGLRK
jgi:hypothetical protein